MIASTFLAASIFTGGFLSPTFLIILVILMIPVTFYAQIRVSSAYSKNAQIASRGHITGREAAEAVMQRAGITDVVIETTEGHLTDHYDPIRKRLVLSEENYNGTSLAALGVAAHEAGHAIQHKVGYSMLHFRMALVPATNFVSRVVPILMLAGFFLARGLADCAANHRRDGRGLQHCATVRQQRHWQRVAGQYDGGRFGPLVPLAYPDRGNLRRDCQGDRRGSRQTSHAGVREHRASE